MRTITKNILSVSLSDIIGYLLRFVAMAFMARRLGNFGFGQISFALAIFSYSFIAIKFGLSTIGVRETARDRRRVPQLVGNIFGLRLTLAVLVFAVVVVLTFVVPQFIAIRPILVIAHLALFPFALCLDWLFQGIEAMENMGYARVLSALSYAVLILLFVRSYNELSLVPAFWLVGTVLETTLLLVLYHRLFGRPGIAFEFTVWRRLLSMSVLVGVGAALAEIARNFPLVIIGFLKDPVQVSYYSAAHRLVFLTLIIDRAFFVVLLPAATRWFNEGEERLRSFLTQAGRLVLILTIPITFGTMVTAPLLIRTIYGAGYEPGAVVLRILIWFFALTVTNTVYCVGLIVVGREREYAMNLLVGTIFHLGTNLVATLLWGIPGAAAAAVASEGLTVGLMYWRFRNTADIKFWLPAVKPLLGSIGMALLIYYLARYNLPLAIIIGIVSYTLLLFLLRGVTRNDLREIGRFVSIRRDPCDRS